MTQDAKTAIRRLFEDVWSRGDLSVLPELMAPDCVAHTAAQTPALAGLEQYRQFVAAYLALYGEIRIVVEAQVAEGDTVATRWTAWPGAAEGAGSGLLGMSFHRVRDGRIAECWDTWDTFAAAEAALGDDALDRLSGMAG